MQAITIKYLPATNTKGSRYKASCAGGSITVNYDYAQDAEGNVKAAVTALLNKLGWTKDNGYTVEWAVGQSKNGTWVAVAIDGYSKV